MLATCGSDATVGQGNFAMASVIFWSLANQG